MEKAMRVAFLTVCILMSIAIVAWVAQWGYVITIAVGNLHHRLQIIEMKPSELEKNKK